MTVSPLISVIIPVYNAEKYLRACVSSVTRQTYKNLDIIMVDDGSTDSSGAICDRLAREDSRITVIHRKNTGIAGAQNVGLDAARGDFIAFCDNDDVMTPRALETLYTALARTKADIAKGRWDSVGASAVAKRLAELTAKENHALADPTVSRKSPDDSPRLSSHPPYTLIREPLKAYQCVFPKTFRLLGGAKAEAAYFNESNWCRLYTASLWNGVRFPEGHYAQDLSVAGELYARARLVVDVGAVLYIWVQHGESVTHSVKTMSFYDDNFQAGARNFVLAARRGVTPARSYLSMKGSEKYAHHASDFHTPRAQALFARDKKILHDLTRRLTPRQRLYCETLARTRLAENWVYDLCVKSRR